MSELKRDFGRHWTYYGEEGIKGYEKTFKGILEGVSLVNFVKKREESVVLDLMAPSDILYDLFLKTKGKHPALGIAVCLEGYRWNYREKNDREFNISQMKGNITDPVTWVEIEEKLADKKADLILERAVGGLRFIPCNIAVYQFLASQVWNLLNPDGGMLVAQVPNIQILEDNHIQIANWVRFLKEKRIEANYVARERYSEYKEGSIKLIKNPKNPINLPFFDKKN